MNHLFKLNNQERKKNKKKKTNPLYAPDGIKLGPLSKEAETLYRYISENKSSGPFSTTQIASVLNLEGETVTDLGKTIRRVVTQVNKAIPNHAWIILNTKPQGQEAQYEFRTQPKVLEELKAIEMEMKENGLQTEVHGIMGKGLVLIPSPLQANLRLSDKQKAILYYLCVASVHIPVPKSELRKRICPHMPEDEGNKTVDFVLNQLNQVLSGEDATIVDMKDILSINDEPAYCILPDTQEVQDLLSKKEMPVSA